MKTKTAIVILITALFASMVSECIPPPEEGEIETKIVLIWNKGYEKQTAQDVVRGMVWTFSWLGAELPEGCFAKAVQTTDSTRFTVTISDLGFSYNALIAINQICDSICRTEEYTTRGGIDVGEFVMLTLGSSYHYYSIVDAPVTLNDFKRKYKLDWNFNAFGVTSSSIAEGNRLIYFSIDTALFRYGFLAMEGHGSLDSGTFTPSYYECFDIMRNGQLRFMVYNEKGDLVSGTPAEYGDAGKPAKCLWCHETSIQPLFIPNTPVVGMMTNEEFLEYRDSMQSRLQRYRFSLKTDMNYANHQEHTLAELLYITYMEPSVMHIAQEWETSEDKVREVLKNEKSYVFEEFDYIGTVYARKDVSRYDQRKIIEVPESARETGKEVNFH